MPDPFDPELVRQQREEIEQRSAQNPGGESPEELRARVLREHAEKLQQQGIQLSHVPEDSIDAPDPPSKVIDGPWRVGGKAEHILQKLEPGEPVFILRAKDIFSVMVIAEYFRIVESYGPSDHEFQETIADTLQNFKDWQGANVDKVRYPD